MIRLVLKLAIAALVAHAAWKTGTAYAAYYKFKDGVTQAAQFGGGKSEHELGQRVLELAAQYGVPLAEDGFTIERRENHTYVKGAYTQEVEIVPGYRYPWRFTLDVDTFTAEAPKLGPPGTRVLAPGVTRA